MASAFLLRRSASSLAPLAATRPVCGKRNYHAAVFTAINTSSVASRKPSFSPLVPNPRYYAKLIKDIPSYYPFKLEDEPGIPTVRLTRTHGGDDIVVEAHMPHSVTGEGEDDDVDDGNKRANQSCIPLVVTVKDGVIPTFEYSCNAYPDEIVIKGLVLKNPDNSKVKETYMGPDFHNLNESLRESLYVDFKRKGIIPSITNFLHEYMINKYKRLVEETKATCKVQKGARRN